MMYRAKVTEYYPAIKLLLGDFQVNYVKDVKDVYAEVEFEFLAQSLEHINSMTHEQIVATLLFADFVREAVIKKATEGKTPLRG